MNVMYTCDNNFVWLMGISTISLFENNKDIVDLKVYLLGENIEHENRLHLKNIAEKYNREIEIIDIPKNCITESLISNRWPSSAFTRLFAAKLLPNSIDKILYIDCDTIICKSINELDNVQFNNNIVLGAKDCISNYYKKNIGLDSENIYINAGVILFNLSAYRNIRINEVINDYIERYRKLICYADQDILNGILKNKTGELSPKYNVMTIYTNYDYNKILSLRKPSNFYTKEEIENAVNDPSIIHFTTSMLIIRPWFANTNHPWASEFKKYMKISPWNNVKLEYFLFQSMKFKIIKFIKKLPCNLDVYVLGILHAVLKPMFIRLKAGICK